MIHRFLLCTFPFALAVTLAASGQPTGSNPGSNSERKVEVWDWSGGSEESSGSSYLGVDIADVSAERLGELKLKEEHGAEVTMVDQDAPAGKAGLHERDVIVSLNGTAVESAAQLRRMIKETPSGRIVTLGISRDGQPMTIKVQLADRRKSMAWEPHVPAMPAMPAMPTMPEFDVPVSVVIVHSSMRSGLMVENITSQLGEFFGVKDGKGVLVRSVEKGSRGEKAGFRAGDVVIKVNNQAVRDSSDFTHALRSSPGTVAVTVIRDKKEQNLTLTLPERKDSGGLLEESFDLDAIAAGTEQLVNRAGAEVARLAPAIREALREHAGCWKDAEEQLQEQQQELKEQEQEMQEREEERQQEIQEQQQEREQELQEQQQEMQREILEQQEMQQKLRHELSSGWAEI
jgi:serine protease Do